MDFRWRVICGPPPSYMRGFLLIGVNDSFEVAWTGGLEEHWGSTFHSKVSAIIPNYLSF